MKKSFIASVKLNGILFFSFSSLISFAQTPPSFTDFSGTDKKRASPSEKPSSVLREKNHEDRGNSQTPEEVINALFGEEGLYRNFNPSDEVIELRSVNSKHFRNPDGTITAVVGAGDLHYQENGQWKEILSHIFPNKAPEYKNCEFAATHNKHKIFFPKNPGKPIVTKIRGEIYEDWGKPALVWLDANANILSEVFPNSSSTGIANKDSLTYKEIFPQIDAVILNSTTSKKLNYLLKDSTVLAGKPANAAFLAFRETIKTNDTWKLTGNKSEEKIFPSSGKLLQNLMFSNAEGKAAVEVKVPYFFEHKPQQFSCGSDTYMTDSTEHYTGSFFVKQNVSNYETYTLVPIQWLTHPNRDFPIVIDPTTDFYPDWVWTYEPTYTTYRGDNSGNFFCTTWGGNYNRTYEYDISYGWADDSWPTNNPFFDGYSTFNISALQDNDCITGVTYWWYKYYSRYCSSDVTLKFGRAQFNENLANQADCNVIGNRIRNNNSYYNGTGKNGANGWYSQAGSTADFGAALPGDQISLGWAYNCEGGDCDGDCCSSLCGGSDDNWHNVYGTQHSTAKPYVSVTYNIASNAPSSASASTNPTCPSQSTTLSISGGTLGTGANWQWYSGSCGGTWVGSGSSISVSPASTTTYYVRAEGTCNTTGCVSVTVNVTNSNSSAPASASASTNPTCPSQATTLSFSGGSLGTGASWYWYSGSCGGTFLGNGTTISVSPASTTTYYIRASGTCNTTSCASVTVTVNSNSAASTSASASVNPTCGGATVLSQTGGTLGTGASYNWYSGSCGGTFVGTGSPSVSPSSTTTYYVRAEGTCNTTSCVNVTVTVNSNSSSPTSASASVNPTCGGATILSQSGGTLGTGANYNWYSGSCGGTFVGTGSPSVSPSSTTTYYVRAEGTCNTTSCASVTITVNSNSSAPSGATASVNPTCGGATILSQSGGTLGTGASYNWYTGSCGGTFVGTGSPSVSPSSTTTYYVRAEGTCNTTSCSSVTITVNSSSTDPTSASASINPTCPSQATTLSVSGGTLGTGASWQWYSGSCGGTFVGTGSPSVSPSSTTTYYVRAEGSCNTTSCTTVTVNVNSNSTDPASATVSVSPVCPSQSTTISVAGGSLGTGASWEWYSGSCGGTAEGTGSSISVSPASTTTYFVRAQGTCNNTNCAIVTVNVNTLSTDPTSAAASINPTCSGDATTLSVSGGFLGTGASWNWFSGSCGGTAEGTGASISVSPTSTTTYYVYAQGTCNTTNCASFTQNVNPLPAADVGATQTICENSGVQIGAAPVGGNTYSWNPSLDLDDATLSSPTASPLSTTTYTLTETITATGCSKSNSVIVNVNPAPAANAGSNQTICNNQSVQLGAAPVAGNTYSWSPATDLDDATISNPTSSATSTTTYTLTETVTATSCQKSNSVTVTVNALPAAITGSDQTICDGDLISLGSAPVGGNTYSWSPVTNLSDPNIANPNANPSSSETYTLTETVVATGCQNSNSVTISVNPSPAAFTGGNQTICNGQSIVLGGAPIGGNTYSWNPATDLDDVTISNPTANPSSDITYILTETISATGCNKANSVTITVNPIPAASVGFDQTICNGQSVMIGASPVGGNTYTWSPAADLDDATISSPIANPPDTIVYTLTETITATGCQNSNSVTVIVNPVPAAFVGSDQTICENSGVQIGGATVPGNTYTWSPSAGLNSTTVSDPLASPTTSQTYSLTETITATGCSNSNSVNVNVNPAPAALVGPNQTICNGQSVQVGAVPVGGNTYSWSPATNLDDATLSDPTANPPVTTVYILTETIPATGCQKSDSVTVNVNQLPVITFNGLAASYCIDAPSSTLNGSPFGGTFSGTGISGNTFDPAVAGIGGPYPINYSYTDGNGCTNDTTMNTTVNDLPVVTYSGFNGPYCASITTPVTLTGNPPGGTFSGPGMSGDDFYPNIANVGNNIIIYNYTDGNNCSSGYTDSVTVIGVPYADFTGLDTSYCVDENTPFTLNGTPSGGTFSGNGISGNDFTPSNAGAGTHTITYTFTDGNGCTNSKNIPTAVHALPLITFSGLDTSYCINGTDDALAGFPNGGAFSGTGISGSSFSPSIAGTGNHPVTYTYTDTNTCTNTVTISTNVYDAPVVSFTGLNTGYCENAPSATLAGTPSGGNFSGTGISGNNFYPFIAGVGTHTITYTFSDGNNCANSSTKNADVYSSPVVTFSGLLGPYCANASSITLSGNPGGGTFTGNGVSGNTFDPAVAGAGTHAIKYVYSDGNGCTDSSSQNVVVNATPFVDFSGLDTAYCENNSPVVLNGFPSGGAFSGSGISGNNFNPFSSGTGSQTITYNYSDGNGCANSISKITMVNSAPVATITPGGATTFCQGNSVDLAASTGSSFVWSTGPTVQTITVSSSGNYSVTITNSSNCSSSASISVNANNNPMLTITSVTDASCNGANDGSASVAASGGAFPYSYLWDVNAANQSSPTATGLNAGNYSVTVSDVNNCSANVSVTINNPSGLNATTNSVNSCTGGNTGTATVNATGGTSPYSYQWDVSAGNQTTSTAIGLAGGTYSVTVTDFNSCTFITSPVVSSNVSVFLSSSNNSNCAGGSIGMATVVPNGGISPYNYQWDTNAGNQTTSTATGLVAGNYNITVTDSNSCIATGTVTISDIQTLATSLSSSPACVGGNTGTASISVSGGTSPYSYFWDSSSGNQTTSTATGLPSGNYFVTVSDSNSCSYSTSVSVGSNSSLFFTSASTPTCLGGTTGTASISPSGGTIPYSYLWDSNANNQNSPTATGLNSGIYSVTVTDGNLCTATASVNVDSVPGVNLSVSSNGGCAGGNSATATATGSGGTVPYSYLWDAGSGNQTSATATGLSSGNYSVTASDANGCSASSSITVSVNSALNASVAGTNVSCSGGNNGSVTANATGGVSPYSYQWNDGQTGNSASNLSTGNYFVIVTDSNSCTDTAQITITAPPAILISDTSSPADCGVNNGSATINVIGGTIPYTYLWDSNTSGQTSPTATGLGVGIYSVTVTDDNGCIKSSSVIVNGTSSLSLGITSTSVSCNGGSDGTAVVVANGGTTPYTYLWSNGQTTSTATGLAVGTYSVTVTNNDSCSAADTVSVTQPPPVTASISNDTTICSGDSINLTASGGTSYLWTSGQNTSTIKVAPSTNSTYSAAVFDNTGCMTTVSVDVDVTPLINASISGDTIVCLGKTASLTAIGGTGYLWSTGDTTMTISVSPVVSSLYSVTSSNSCFSDSSSTVVSVSYILASATKDTTILIGANAQLNATGGILYLWEPPTNLSCTNCPNPVANPLSTTMYFVTVTDGSGCAGIDTVNVTIDDSKSVFIPNIFSPNGDGENDVLYVFGKGIVKTEFSIFDRWGAKVFESASQNKGWDGISSVGTPFNTGVYVYYLTVEFYDGSIQSMEGNITLVK